MTYDLTRCLLHLVPGAQFGTSNNDYALTEWLDARPMPTRAEVEAAWPVIQAQDLADAQAAQTATGNDLTLRQQAEAALVDLRAFRDRTSTTLSTAQNIAILKLLCRVAIGLIRLALRKLDRTD